MRAPDLLPEREAARREAIRQRRSMIRYLNERGWPWDRELSVWLDRIDLLAGLV